MKLHLPFSLHPRWRVVAALALLMVLGGLTVARVRGDDPWDVPDSYFTATGPDILDQQTTDANQARTDAAAVQIATEKKNAEAAFVGTRVPVAEPASIPDLPLVTGVMTGSLPLPAGWSSTVHIENSWQNVVGNTRLAAYAGLLYDGSISSQVDTTANPAQGIIVTVIGPATNASTAPYGGGSYTTATRTGSLHITAAVGNCLSLVSTMGTQYQFDAGAGTWSCQAGSRPPP